MHRFFKSFAAPMRLFCVAFSKATSPRAVAPRRAGAPGVSFVSFSLRLCCQRKADKEVWYLKIVPLTIDTKTPISLFLFESIAPKRKSFAKRKRAVFCAHAARARAFEKARQNNRWVQHKSLKRWTKLSLMLHKSNLSLEEFYEFAFLY